MKIYRRTTIIISLIIGIILTGCSNNFQTSKDKEIKQMKDEIDILKSQLAVLEDELIKKENECQALLNEKNESNNKDEDIRDFSYISINKNKVSPSISIINEHGFNLDSFCEYIGDDMKIEIIDYSNKTFGGHMGANIPTQLKLSFNDKSIEFEGVVYASPVNGAPIAEYIAGFYGDIRARYKGGIVLNDKYSLTRLFELIGIGCTFYDDKSIDFCTIVEK